MKKNFVSGVLLTLLLMGAVAMAVDIQPAKAASTIYIRADGSVDPDTAPISSVDNVTYTFTDNIYDEIVVERDNIVVDGAGYTLQGTGLSLDSKGISLSGRSNVTIKNTEIGAFYDGIYLEDSYGNSISGNNITNNDYGIYLRDSLCNVVYHNSFIDNTFQTYVYSSNSKWDDGYPSGGNCWSDYSGVDLYSGPYQNVTGSDGIGDTPYIIDSDNQDNYPFMVQSGWKNTELTFSFTPNPLIVGQTVTLLGNLTDRLGNPIDNTNVDIYLNGTYTATLFTNSSGWFKASAPVNTPGTYGVTIAYNGSDTYNPCSHDETLLVYLKLDTMVEFTLSPNPATVGQTITLKGNLTDIDDNPIGGAPLELYLKVGSGPWQLIGTLSTNSSGWFQASGTVASAGTYQVAVLYRGTSQYNLSYSIETLTVNP